MKVDVGTIKTDWDGFNRIAGIADATQLLFGDPVELDFSNCTFFEANMVAPLQAVIARLYDELNDVSVKNLKTDVQNILRKNGFLEAFGLEAIPDIHMTTLPLKRFKKDAVEQFYEYLDRYMNEKGIPHMSDALTKRFRESLFEIFQNSTLHSKSSLGIFVCGQFYPHKYKLDFTIADAGIGIRDNVRKYLKKPKLTSRSAIEWALVEGNTTKTGKQPGGLGLKLIKEFIKKNSGKIQIVSRFGYYEFQHGDDSFLRMDHDFPGTIVNIEINTNDIKSYRLSSDLRRADIF